jgi:hypothetical protein
VRAISLGGECKISCQLQPGWVFNTSVPPDGDAIAVNIPSSFAAVDFANRVFWDELLIFGIFSDLSTLLFVATISTAVELEFFGLSLREEDVID